MTNSLQNQTKEYLTNDETFNKESESFLEFLIHKACPKTASKLLFMFQITYIDCFKATGEKLCWQFFLSRLGDDILDNSTEEEVKKNQEDTNEPNETNPNITLITDERKISQLERKKIFLENKKELEKMRDVKKGTRYRKWLYNRLLWLSQKVFDTEQEEYEAIQKFPRGMWCKYETTFKTKKEKEFMIEIAKGFGAFNY